MTAPLEQAVVGVKGVRGITSVSETGSSRITVELDPKADLEFTRLALREEIAKVERSLPYGVRPSLDPYVPEDFRVRPFLSYTISANLPLQKIRETVKDRLEFGLGSVKGRGQGHGHRGLRPRAPGRPRQGEAQAPTTSGPARSSPP